MIVSHQHKFIFVKTRKTAGTSIEVFLSSLAGPDAVVTPFTVSEGIDHHPRNWHRRFNPWPEVADRLRRTRSLRGSGARGALADLRAGRAFYNHMPARLIIARLGRRVWEEYFTFCFERDPWEKTASWYWFATRDDPDRPPFDRWVTTAELPSDWDLYTLDDRVAVDFVGRFESLQTDLERVLSILGLDVPVELPRAKGGFRPQGDPVRFDAGANRRIAAVFAREIETFGYPDRSAAD